MWNPSSLLDGKTRKEAVLDPTSPGTRDRNGDKFQNLPLLYVCLLIEKHHRIDAVDATHVWADEFGK